MFCQLFKVPAGILKVMFSDELHVFEAGRLERSLHWFSIVLKMGIRFGHSKIFMLLPVKSNMLVKLKYFKSIYKVANTEKIITVIGSWF